MASDEDVRLKEILLRSSLAIGKLLSWINKMSKKSEINMELNESLNSFMDHLNEQQRYLELGIVSLKFAEAGLFLQTAANVYSQKVDILWDSTLQYQMQLSTYNKLAEQNADEAAKLTQRLNKNKRKKIIIQDVDSDPTLYGDLNATCNKANDFLKALEQTLNYQNEAVSNNQVGDNQSSTSNEEAQDLNCVNGWRLPIDCPVRDDKTKEKLCNYNDLYLNCAVPYLETSAEQNNGLQLVNFQNDLLLQKYLIVRSISYRDFCKSAYGEQFETFKQTNQACVVQRDEENLTEQNVHSSLNESSAVPSELHQLTSECNENSDLNITVQQLIQTDKQSEIQGCIQKGSERISNADSLFHDEQYSTDTENSENGEPQSQAQLSRADSGICFSEDPNASSVVEGHDEHLEEHLETNGFGLHETTGTNEIPKSDGETKECNPQQTQNVEGCLDTLQNANDNRPSKSDKHVPSITVVHKSNLSPMEKTKTDNLKRKLSKVEVEAERREKTRKSKRFRWLKTHTVLLSDYEKFFKKHYQPEFDEGWI